MYRADERRLSGALDLGRPVNRSQLLDRVTGGKPGSVGGSDGKVRNVKRNSTALTGDAKQPAVAAS
jgi:hypothetical protein